MAITTASQSQLGQDTAKNSQIVTTSVRLINSGASTGPAITSVIVTDSGYNTLDDTAAATSNSYIRILGTGFQSTANVFLNGTMVPKANVTFVSSTELRAVLPVSNTGNYAVSVYNSNSSGALYSSSFVISTMPQWLTSANLTNVPANTPFSTTLSASSDSNITYSNTTALPAGTTLAANGLFSGAISTQATYTFDVKATDAENQDTTRTFNLTIISDAVTIEYLVVAGGGGGAADDGGGGGAGGFRTGSLTVTPGETITVTVGAGGSGALRQDPDVATAGQNSVFGSIISSGGGAGHKGDAAPSKSNGGSGGGGGYPSGIGGTGIAGQGNSGGNAGSFTGAGGGGGAGAAGDPGQSGASSTTMNAGNGGAGLSSSISGSSVFYAGGGGGGSRSGGGSGGNGGGGGGRTAQQAGSAGSSNTGGGGGGSGDVSTGGNNSSYNGGSGIVIIRYLNSNPAATSAPGASVTSSGSYRIYTWTSSGTFTL
jgi:hypothetical protein